MDVLLITSETLPRAAMVLVSEATAVSPREDLLVAFLLPGALSCVPDLCRDAESAGLDLEK